MGLPEHKIKRAIDHIHNHLADDLSLEVIAKVAGMSPYYFARLFKQVIGKTPHQYILHCRMECAKQLLLENTCSITEVAAQVGFVSLSHFSKRFCKHTGMSPKSYREQ
jgi:AraC family transcriptional regulator